MLSVFIPHFTGGRDTEQLFKLADKEVFTGSITRTASQEVGTMFGDLNADAPRSIGGS